MSTPLEQLKPGAAPDAPRGASGIPAAPPPQEPLNPEEAGSQALAEALRSSFAIVKIIMVLLVIVFFASGVFTVPSQQQAILLRFGRPVGTGEDQLLKPGLHWSFPYPIDEVVRIPKSQIQSVMSTTGWYYVAPGEEDNQNADAQTASLNPASDGYTLTGDGNIIHVKATLRYRINDALQYTLNFVNASNVLQSALDNALIYASAQLRVDQALKSYNEFKEKVVSHVQQLVDAQKLGVTIENADLTVIPPRHVKSAFRDVITADLKRRQVLSEAQSYATSNSITADSEARVIINNAKTERTRLVQIVAAEANYFTNQLPNYRNDGNVFLARLQTEAFGRILTNAQYKVLRMDNGEKAMRIQVSREPEKPPAAPR